MVLRVGVFGYELGEYSYGGVLVLEGVVSGSSRFFVFIFVFSRGFGGKGGDVFSLGDGFRDVFKS